MLGLPMDKMKKESWRSSWLLHKVEDINKKIGPSERGVEVVMRFYGWMHKILMQKNVTLYCPLYVEIYYAVRRFYYFHNKFVQSLFSPH